MSDNRKTNAVRCAAVIVTGLTLLSAPAVRAQDQGPFAGLAGAWVGEGTVTMSNGSNERIRCRASYSVPSQGMSMNQGLRCASDSYKFEVKSNVVAERDGSLSGTWSEATRQVTGDLTGRVSPGHIQTSVETFGFSAQLSVATHGSRQSVSIQPQGTDVQGVSIDMRRI